MRAQEFIIEYKAEEYNGLRFATDIKNGQLIVRALNDWGTNELGHAVFNIGDQDELDPQDLEVDSRYQGQGIAKTMYDYVKTLGYKIHRSWDQTPAGAGFWNKHRGEDERVWEQLDEGWKERLAAAGIGAAMTLGGQQAYNQYNQQPQTAPQPQPQIQQQQLTPKQILIQTAKKAGITGNELAQLLAQSAHETLNFTRMREAGTPEYFTKKYEQHRKTARILGNKVKGDGERYKGRGFIQLTGRDNYTRAGKALGLPLEANPDLAAEPDNAAKIAVWYWQNRVAPKVQDFTNTKAVTKTINPAGKHQDRRQQQFAKYQMAQNETA
jgi:predicted chitinase/GNAT superfamily N-acetyltransferase